jgi:Superinfection immunity protein
MSAMAVITYLIVLVVGVLLYLLPTLVASRRNARNMGSVAVINILLGWTVIGWVVALAMAVADTGRRP